MKKSYNAVALVLLFGYSPIAQAGLFGQALVAAAGYVASLFKGPEDMSDIRNFKYQEVPFTPEVIAAHRALHAQVSISDHNLDTLLQAADNSKMLFEARDPEGDLVGSLVLTKGQESGDNYEYELTSMALNVDASAEKQLLVARNFWFSVTLRGVGKEQKLGKYCIEAPVYPSQSSDIFMQFLQSEQFRKDEKLTEERRAADPRIQDVYLHTFCAGMVGLVNTSANGREASLSKRVRTGDDLKPL